MRAINVLTILLFIVLSSYHQLVEGIVEVDESTATTNPEGTTSESSTSGTSDAATTTEESVESIQRQNRKESIATTSSTSEESLKSSIKSTVTSNKKTNDVDDTQFDAIQLNSRNFGKHISDGNIWLIEFYSPQCIHCVEFASSYSDIAKYYNSQSISGKSNPKAKKQKKKQRYIKVGKVNGAIERALVSRFAINAFPCFFLIDGFRVYKYGGLRSKKSLMAFAEGGYKKDATVSFIESPMGPLGIFQGTLMSTGHIFLDIFQWSQDTFGLSPLIVGMILFGAMFMGFFFLIVSLALIIPEKPKRA